MKRFCYLAYDTEENNGNEIHRKKVAGKAMVILGRIWSIEEGRLKEDWKKRCQIFDPLVSSVLLYEVDIWGYEKVEDFEEVEPKYIRWVLKLDRCTPGHIILRQTGREIVQTGLEFDKRIAFEIKVVRVAG